MKKTRFTESQINNILKEGESGVYTVPEPCRTHDVGKVHITNRSLSMVGYKPLMRELEVENAKLKRYLRMWGCKT